MRIYFDDQLVFEHENYGTPTGQWRKASVLDIPSETQIIGISCQNNGLGPHKGILASTSNGIVTDKNWICTSKKSNDGDYPSPSAKFYTAKYAPQTGTIPGKRLFRNICVKHWIV